MSSPQPSGTFEVEQKFAVADPPAFEQQLIALGVQLGPAQLQIDRYFAHPLRDFAQTDEALRIRCTGDDNRITYKGPKMSLKTKARREIELPLSPKAAGLNDFTVLLESLGFSRVAEVRKRRRHATIQQTDRDVGLVLDDVEQVGIFCELELCTDEQGLNSAEETIIALANRLGLSTPIRRSYLGMLLDKQDG